MTSLSTPRRVAVATLLLSTALAPVASFAQGGAAGAPPAPPTAAQQQQMLAQMEAQQAVSLKKELGFSDAQVKKFQAKQRPIYAAFQNKINAMRKKYGDNPTGAQKQQAIAELQPAARKMGQDLQAALMSVATPAQQAKIKAKMAQAQAAQKAGTMGSGAPAPKP